MRALPALFALLALMGTGASAQGEPTRDVPVLVPDVSQHTIDVRQGFTGTELLLFGAIMTPEGTRAGRDYDIVVVLEGPARQMILREKRKVAGMWVNADSTTLRSVPSYYAVAAPRPLRDIVDERTAAIYELGLGSLQLSPAGTIEPAAQARFAGGLVDLMSRHGLYNEDDHAVTMTDDVLYRARIRLPSSVLTGTYTAETFAIRHGRVVASAVSTVEVRKQGFERAVADFARHNGFQYGLMVITLSVLMGWLAGRLFARE